MNVAHSTSEPSFDCHRSIQKEVSVEPNLLKATLEKSVLEDAAKSSSTTNGTPTVSDQPPSNPAAVFPTKDGTLYVSKPFRSTYSKRLKAAVTFVPRTSHFDIGNEMSGANEFRVRSVNNVIYMHSLI